MMGISKFAKCAAGTAVALSLVVGGFSQPMGFGNSPDVQVPDKLPELLKAIAVELEALWDKVSDIPALKETLKMPMELAKEALESLKEREERGKEALKDLIVLSLALHRVEDVFEHGVGQRVKAHFWNTGPGRAGGPERGPMGQRLGPKPGRFEEIRDWIEAYLKGAMSALSPEEAARFRGIIGGLVQGLREEFVSQHHEIERPATEAMGLGRHLIRIKALSAKLDLFLIRTIGVEKPTTD